MFGLRQMRCLPEKEEWMADDSGKQQKRGVMPKGSLTGFSKQGATSMVRISHCKMDYGIDSIMVDTKLDPVSLLLINTVSADSTILGWGDSRASEVQDASTIYGPFRWRTLNHGGNRAWSQILS